MISAVSCGRRPGSILDYDQPGHVIVASSGDTGYNEDYPAYPATNPNLVAVGGTSLSATSDDFWGNETVWNDGVVNGYLNAAGSLCNASYPAPPWQASDPHAAAEGCDAYVGNPLQLVFYRASADVSADADPDTGLEIYQSFDPNISADQVLGGTSLSRAADR